jgi:hypothetical protein
MLLILNAYLDLISQKPATRDIDPFEELLTLLYKVMLEHNEHEVA